MFTINFHSQSCVYYVASNNSTIILFTFYVKDQSAVVSYKVVNNSIYLSGEKTIQQQVEDYIKQVNKSGCCGSGVKNIQWKIKNDLTITQ